MWSKIQDTELTTEAYILINENETFGLGPESYSLGIMCGFMSLHNAIEAEVESFT